MSHTKQWPVFTMAPTDVVTRADCSDAAWALLAQMSNRIVSLQDQLRAARAVICEEQGHLPMSGSTGTWCELCHKRIDSTTTTTSTELRFEDLPEDLQWCARATYIDAGVSVDSHFYLVSSRRELVSRNKVRQLTAAKGE